MSESCVATAIEPGVYWSIGIGFWHKLTPSLYGFLAPYGLS